MTKSLAQIVATFVAVWVTFLAAYLGYLYSLKSSIDEKISYEGFRICGILEKHTSQLFFAFNDIGAMFVKEYRKEFPKKRTIDIYDIVFEDIEKIMLKDANTTLKHAEGIVNDKLPYFGRMYVFLLDGYIQELFPPGMTKRTLGYSIPYHYTPKPNDYIQHQLFPLGLSGLDNWIEEFKRVSSTIKVRSIFFLGNYQNDLNKYLVEISKSKHNHLLRYDYIEWISAALNDINLMEESANRVESLLRLRESNSIKNRLPHLKPVLALLIFIVLSGIVAPLVIEALGLTDSLNGTANLIILLAVLLPFAGLAGITAIDLRHQDSELAARYYIKDIKVKLEKIQENVDQNRYTDWSPINDYAEENNRAKIPSEAGVMVGALIDSIVALNTSNADLARKVFQAVENNKQVRENTITEVKGGRGLGPLEFVSMSPEDILKQFSPGQVWVFELDNRTDKVRTLRVLLPSDTDSYHELFTALLSLREELINSSEFRDYQRKKKDLKSIVQRLFNFLAIH